MKRCCPNCLGPVKEVEDRVICRGEHRNLWLWVVVHLGRIVGFGTSEESTLFDQPIAPQKWRRMWDATQALGITRIAEDDSAQMEIF